MSTKSLVTAADLFVLLDREFQRRRPRECENCFVPLPYLVDAAEDEPNWEIVPPRECPHRCELLLDELVHDYQQHFSLRFDVGKR